jgi:hypothetical protein
MISQIGLNIKWILGGRDILANSGKNAIGTKVFGLWLQV